MFGHWDITSFNEQVLALIASTIQDADTQDDLVRERNGLGSIALRIMYERASKQQHLHVGERQHRDDGGRLSEKGCGATIVCAGSP